MAAPQHGAFASWPARACSAALAAPALPGSGLSTAIVSQRPCRQGRWGPVAGVKSCHLPACFRCEASRAVSAASQWQLARPDPSPRFDERLDCPQAQALVVKRAAKRTGRQTCWSSHLEGARGSGTFKECQSLVGGIP